MPSSAKSPACSSPPPRAVRVPVRKIYVRGYGSMNAKNDPLWVVDGVPYEGDINNINAADIESISVLKNTPRRTPYTAPARTA